VKILVLAEEFGGERLHPAGLWLSELTRRWAERGHQTTVVCTGRPDPDGSGPEPPPPGVHVERRGPEGFEEVLGEALQANPDVVHVAGGGPFGARVIEILRELPLLLDVHDFWPICPNDDLMRRPRLEACGEHFPFLGCGECAGLPRLRAMEERAELAAAARVVVAHSAFQRERLSLGLGRPVDLLGYGVDVSRFRADAIAEPTDPDVRALLETRDRPRVLFLGPPTPARGAGRLTDLLVALRARLGEVELVVAGQDLDNRDWSAIFMTEVGELGLRRNAVLLPRVSNRDLPPLYASCRVGIAPGYGHEIGGLFLLQALASGLPVVAHPAGGVDEWIHSGSEGLLVSAGDIASFAGSVATLLIDPLACNAFGESGRLAALERHDFERSVVALEETYRRLGAQPSQHAAA
jgi:glycosyltransferase involved in cell wall biosynthesis